MAEGLELYGSPGSSECQIFLSLCRGLSVRMGLEEIASKTTGDKQEHHIRRRSETNQYKMTKPCDLT